MENNDINQTIDAMIAVARMTNASTASFECVREDGCKITLTVEIPEKKTEKKVHKDTLRG